MKIKKDGTPDKRFKSDKKQYKDPHLLKLYWDLRKSGSPDWMDCGIYISDGVYLTKNGEFVHTRD